MKSIPRYRLWGMVLVLGCLMGAGIPVLAQTFEGMKGRLTDAEGKPLAGHRAVYRPVNGEETIVSGVSDANGNYIVSLPLGGEFVPIALVTPNGGRIELPADEPPLLVRKGGGRNIQLPVGVTSAAADNRDIPVGGRLADADGNPLAGYRVVFKFEDDIVLSDPSLANGEYSILLRERVLFTPLAAIAPNGLRIPLPDEPPLQPRSNTRRDLTIAIPRAAREPAFPGAERLFLSFAEDTATPDAHDRVRLEIAHTHSREIQVPRVIAAVQLPGLEDTELGLDLGYGTYDPDQGADVTGPTDLDLWAKLNLGAAMDGTGYAVGFVLTVPMGEEAPGLGHDAWGTKVFVAGRRALGRGTLTTNVGLRITGDGTTLGVDRDGRLSGAVGSGWITTLHPNVTLVLEGVVESERFSGDEAEFRVLGGVNWRIRDLTFRLAVAGGLTDATPDSEFLAGFVLEF